MKTHFGLLASSTKPASISIYLFGRSFGLGRGRRKRRSYTGQIGCSGALFGRVWFALLRR